MILMVIVRYSHSPSSSPFSSSNYSSSSRPKIWLLGILALALALAIALTLALELGLELS